MNIGDIVEWYDGEDNRMGFVRDLGKGGDMGIRVSGNPDPCAPDNDGMLGWSAWTMEAEVKVANSGGQPTIADALRDLIEEDLIKFLSSKTRIPPVMFNPDWRDGLDAWTEAMYMNTLAADHPEIRDLILELQKVETLA